MRTALKKGIAKGIRWHIRRDGSRFLASSTVSPIENGEFDGFVKISSDQTKRIQAERAKNEKEMLQKLVGAQEDERKRIARDLHDELGQQLVALRLKLDQLRRSCATDAEANAQLDYIERLARNIDEGVDFLSWELRPASLDQFGLPAALEKYVHE